MKKTVSVKFVELGMKKALMAAVSLSLWGTGMSFAGEQTTVQNPEAKEISGVKTPYEFRQVYYRYIPEENFMRITEFFDGEENPGVRKLVRSTQESRSGFYFVLRLKPGWQTLQEGSHLNIHYIPADAIRPVVQRFELNEEIRAWKGEIFFGLTGDQWQKEGGEPMAWKLQLVSPTGEVLAEQPSFLWKDHPSR